MRLKDNGDAIFGYNVGIGTAVPNDVLTIQGADNGLTIKSEVANRPVISLINGSSTMLKISANGTYGAIGDGSDANRYMTFLDGKVGVKTQPIGSFNVVGTSTIHNGYQDPDLTVVNGNGHSNAASGEISMVHTYQGTGANNDLFEFQYDATSWKSFGFEIDISTAVGWGKVCGGGYNNGGVSGSYNITGSKITAFAFDNVAGNNQAHILRCTFGGGVHHTVRVKYWQGGGDGGPRADRATMRFIS